MNKINFCLTFTLLSVAGLLSCKKTASVSNQIIETSSVDHEISTFDTSSLSKGLVAYYPFNGNANDSSGNNHNGSIHHATLTIDRHGALKSAYYFNGNSSFIKVPNDSTLNLTGSFSISSWFNLTNYATSYNGSMIISKHDGDLGNSGFIYWVVNADHNNNQNLLFQANGAWGIGPNPRTYVLTNTWYDYTITYSKNTDSLKYYLDGVLVSSQKIPIRIIGNKQPMYIGYSKSSYGTYFNYFNGTIDDIRIYNRVLPVKQIRYLSEN